MAAAHPSDVAVANREFQSCVRSFPNGVDVACTFSASGKIRGAAQILDSEGTATMAIPATVK